MSQQRTLTDEQRNAYLEAGRREALAYIQKLAGAANQSEVGTAAVLDYPLREAKGLRPSLAIAACRALGGELDEIVPTAAALELCHNAFLVHDDIEDGSELRRGGPTLAAKIGVPLAVHTGDMMLALVLEPLLENLRLLDVGRALRILELVARVVRTTSEGQTQELIWIHEGRWDIRESDYLGMVRRKTAWYSFVAPLLAGGLVAGAPEGLLAEMEAFGLNLGVAFQIRDDVLNLLGTEDHIGKESCGDLWEGKRTLVLSHYFEHANPVDLEFARSVLIKKRPDHETAARRQLLGKILSVLRDGGSLEPATERAFLAALESIEVTESKSQTEIACLRERLDSSIEYASRVARQFAADAAQGWAAVCTSVPPSTHRDFIDSIVRFVVDRTH
jgi:geranylgeranyl diphosphate synthase type II